MPRSCMRRRTCQEQLAEQARTSQQFVSDLERGKCNPTVVTFYELAPALGVAPVELVRED